ncbi:hypothetical protein PIB30_108797, partial [Stylosanthes scabra]|nr:hypothetical protein [Stylosanthes scabra]
MTQLSTINKKLEKLEASVAGTQIICGICGGPHENHNCISVQDDKFSATQVNYVNNQPSLHTMIFIRILTILVGGITQILVGEIKDSRSNSIIKLLKILKDNLHSLQLNDASSLRVLGDRRPFEERLKQRRGRKAQASHVIRHLSTCNVGNQEKMAE